MPPTTEPSSAQSEGLAQPEGLAQRLAELEAALQAAEAARQQAETQFHEAEARYRTLVEQIPAITYIVDVQGPIGTTIYISPRVKDILGYTPEEWLADPDLWQKLLHPVDRDYVLSEVVRQNTVGASLRLTYRSLTRDNRVVWFQNQSTILRDEHGRPRYTHGIMLDITERKEAERALYQYKIQLEKEATARTAELNRAQRELATLHRLAQTLTSARDFPAILNLVAQELVALFNARGSLITRLNPTRTALTVVAHHSPNAAGRSAVGTVMPLADDAALLNVVEKGCALVIVQAETNPLAATMQALLGAARPATYLMVAPLLVRGAVIGTISVDTDSLQREFAPAELTLMETVAGQMAGALENAHRLETEQAEPLPAATTPPRLPQQVSERPRG